MNISVNGFAPLLRSISNHPVTENHFAFSLYVKLVLACAFTERREKLARGIISVGPSELAGTFREMGEAFHFSTKTLKKLLGELEELCLVEVETSKLGTLVRVLKPGPVWEILPHSPEAECSTGSHTQGAECSTGSHTHTPSSSFLQECLNKKANRPGVEEPQLLKKAAAPKERTPPWEDTHPLAQIFTHLWEIPAYRKIFSLKVDTEACEGHMKRYGLTRQELEHVAYDLRWWAQDGSRTLKSPRGTLNTFAKKAAEKKAEALAKAPKEQELPKRRVLTAKDLA